MPFKMQRVYMLFRQENQERVTNELKHIQNKESDIPSLLNFPDLKIPQVPELYDIFGFCQDNSTYWSREISSGKPSLNSAALTNIHHLFHQSLSLGAELMHDIEFSRSEG